MLLGWRWVNLPAMGVIHGVIRVGGPPIGHTWGYVSGSGPGLWIRRSRVQIPARAPPPRLRTVLHYRYYPFKLVN